MHHTSLTRLTTFLVRFLLTFLWGLVPAIAYAHVNAGETVGFFHGFQHPLGGLDHILAMVAVGLWAVQLGGYATWMVPITFVTLMAVGGVLGIASLPIPFVEQGIIASDLILGGLVLLSTRLPIAFSVSIVGFLAVFHGYAHGTEMPKDAMAMEYAIGFILATASLHIAGLGLAVLAQKILRERLIQFAGGAIMIGGIYLLVKSFV